MNARLQELYPLQARFYRAMRFYRTVQWAVLLWAASIVPVSVGVVPRFLPWPWGILPLFLQLLAGVLFMAYGFEYLETRYRRCRRVYRVLNWTPQLRFSHRRAWSNWPDESCLPKGVWVEHKTQTLVP